MATDNKKNINKKKFLAVMRRPAFYILINFFLVNILLAFLPYGLGDILYNLGRISIIFYAGWLVLRKKLGTIRHAALTGMFMYFIDHVLLKGGIFLLNFMFKPEGLGLAAFSGVIVSFIIFIPVAMSVGAMGGFFARSGEEGTSVDSQ
jgi:hypothetical protein